MHVLIYYFRIIVFLYIDTYINKQWCISFHPFLLEVMRKNGGRANTMIEGDTRAFFDLPNSW